MCPNGSIFEYKKNFYTSVILNPKTLVNIATSIENWEEILDFHCLLATDEYVEYVDRFYRKCIQTYGKNWIYLDIINILFAASKVLKPTNYLEIGVRRGRSLCTVVRGNPTVNITAFDMWIPNYADMDNPGADFVLNELKKHNYCGNIEFINGDSHKTVVDYFNQNPNFKYDLITVDGDHSEEGAFDDLCNVIPHLSVGGVIVFDDIVHPQHPYLMNVWKKVLNKFSFLSSYEYTEMGYGIAFAIRKSE